MDIKSSTLSLAIVAMTLTIVSCGSDSDSESDSSPGNVSLYEQSFTGFNDSPWPLEWIIPSETDTPLTEVTIQTNRGYLEGVVGAQRVTRMVMQSTQAENFETTFSIQFTDFATQGIGFYGRQNGGRLLGTNPTGCVGLTKP